MLKDFGILNILNDISGALFLKSKVWESENDDERDELFKEISSLGPIAASGAAAPGRARRRPRQRAPRRSRAPPRSTARSPLPSRPAASAAAASHSASSLESRAGTTTGRHVGECSSVRSMAVDSDASCAIAKRSNLVLRAFPRDGQRKSREKENTLSFGSAWRNGRLCGCLRQLAFENCIQF